MLNAILYFLKKSFECLMANKKHSVLLFIMFLLFAIILNNIDGIYHQIVMVAYVILFVSYGIQLTREVINGKEVLPAFNFKDIPRGIMTIAILFVYGCIQALLFFVIASVFDFPSFEVEEFILKFPETIHLIYTHSPVDSVLFFALSLIVLYVVGFFMEIALAHLADGGRFLDSFNLKLLKIYVDKIGWVTYIKDYTAVLLLLLVFTLFDFVPVITAFMSTLSVMLILIVEFTSIGFIFRKTKT